MTGNGVRPYCVQIMHGPWHGAMITKSTTLAGAERTARNELAAVLRFGDGTGFAVWVYATDGEPWTTDLDKGVKTGIDHYALISASVTLDGRPARIVGARQPYATVRDFDGRSAEWSWTAAERIVTLCGGRFAS